MEAPAEDLPFEDGVVRLDECREHGFRLVERESYANEVSFSVEKLASYLMTQRTWLRFVESGAESSESVHAWLVVSLTPMFGETRGTFRFDGVIEYLRALVV